LPGIAGTCPFRVTFDGTFPKAVPIVTVSTRRPAWSEACPGSRRLIDAHCREMDEADATEPEGNDPSAPSLEDGGTAVLPCQE